MADIRDHPDVLNPISGVSRETIADFSQFFYLLLEWQKKINLVGPSTLETPWTRHFLDSAQLFPHLPPSPRVLDLGSGAGFPGLVLALLLKGDRGHVQLAESDGRKCSFLREAIRVTAAPALVLQKRIETLTREEVGTVSVITARALKPLPELLALAAPFVSRETKLLFLKGQDVEDELTQARKYWKLDAKLIPSLSDPRGVILSIESLARE